jgi:RNA polymerase sigma factor (sigma-70 family)
VATPARVGAAQENAARSLYERYSTQIYRYALSQVHSPQDAEDAVQMVFMRAFTAMQRGVVPENEAAWLFKIAHNVCASSKLAWLRRRRVEAPRDISMLDVEPAAQESDRTELVGLEDALAAMPPRPRAALLMRDWQGLSYAEIAEKLETSHSAVETLIFRARRMLAQQLEAPVKRVKQALGVGPLLNALRSLVEGGSVALKATAVLAVAGGAAVAAQPLSHAAHRATRHQPPPAHHGLAPAHATSSASASSPAASAAHRPPVRGAHHATAHVVPPPALGILPTPEVPAVPSPGSVPPGSPGAAAPAEPRTSQPAPPAASVHTPAPTLPVQPPATGTPPSLPPAPTQAPQLPATPTLPPAPTVTVTVPTVSVPSAPAPTPPALPIKP